MWEIDENNLMNQMIMIKWKGLVTNVQIDKIKRKIENEGRYKENDGTTQQTDNTTAIYDENDNMNPADSESEEPNEITENDLSDSKRNRLLRLTEALENDNFDKATLKYGDKEKLREEGIKLNKVLEHVKITGFTHFRISCKKQ